jgi:cobalamin biosynthesis protein CobT
MVAKNLTKNAFYTKKQGISLDTTVSILVDESGSMYNSVAHCRSLAIAMAEVLERLDIKFEILGHTTGTNSRKIDADTKNKFDRDVQMIIFEHKNFNESYRNEKYRLGSIDSLGCNVDGEALLTTFKRAMEQRSNRHIILVISDGEPTGAKQNGYNHLRNAVKFCRNNGAEVYAFGIGTNAPKQFYGEENFVYLPSIKEMNGHFFRQLSNIIVQGSMVK